MPEQNKTLREWLNELPEPCREKAITNAEKSGLTTIDAAFDSCKSTATSLARAFSWGATPEGFDYWSEAHASLFK